MGSRAGQRRHGGVREEDLGELSGGSLVADGGYEVVGSIKLEISSKEGLETKSTLGKGKHNS